MEEIDSPQGRRITRMYKVAVKALKKQVTFYPIKGINKNYPQLGTNYYCKCGAMFVGWENNKTKYCGNCGQKLGRKK
jgi:hypothetical protein